MTTPQVRHALGFDFINKQLTLFEPEADVIQKLKKVVERMSAKGFRVNDIYYAKDRLKWIQDVLGLQPAPTTPSSAPQPVPATTGNNGNVTTTVTQPTLMTTSSGGNSTSQPSTAGAGTTTLAPTQPVSSSPSPTPSAPSVYYTLINPGNPLPATTSDKIKKIYKELQIVNISGPAQRIAPHAVGALLRILVEISAQEYLRKTQNFYIDKNNNFRNPKDPSKSVNELKAKLDYIAHNCGLPGDIAHVLIALLARQLMTAELNQVMHNTIFTADATAIKAIWQNFETVFDYLIGEMK